MVLNWESLSVSPFQDVQVTSAPPRGGLILTFSQETKSDQVSQKFFKHKKPPLKQKRSI